MLSDEQESHCGLPEAAHQGGYQSTEDLPLSRQVLQCPAGTRAEISVRHTRGLFGGNLGILFYDVTTFYFETMDKDELRESGFSKDGKNSNPQIVPGLLVSRGEYPLSYSLFNGSQYEGYTMLPIVDDFVQRFNLGKDFIVIADADLMMSTRNLPDFEVGQKLQILIGWSFSW